MRGQVNGLTDIHTLLANERKVGGAIEAKSIRLRTGEEYELPVITSIDFAGTLFYSIGFVTKEGQSMIVNVNDISMIAEPQHKRICELQNDTVKQQKMRKKLHYLKRLCELNEGSCLEPFVEEVQLIVNDIGLDVVEKEINLAFLHDETNVIKIA